MFFFDNLKLGTVLSELNQFSSLILWSVVPPLISPYLHLIYRGVKGRLFSIAPDNTRTFELDKKRCRAFALVLVLAGLFCRSILRSEQSFFRQMGYEFGCDDERIKREYRLYLKKFHPDKSREVPADFEYKKTMFEMIKDRDKCIKYDIFGVEKGDVKMVPKTEKEWFMTFLVESGIFYASGFALFFGLPVFFRPSDEYLEPLLALLILLVLDIEAVLNYRGGITGYLLSFLERLTGHLSLFELRSIARSSIFNFIIFCRHFKGVFQEPIMNVSERCKALTDLNLQLKKIREKLEKSQ